MFWTFLATFVILIAFMFALALGTLLGRRKRECSCKTAARIMATQIKGQKNNANQATDSPLNILDQEESCQQCNNPHSHLP